MNLREFNARHAAKGFGMTENEAYELQRSLRSHEHFMERMGPGRSGPGGGVEANDSTVTYFIISALIGGPRNTVAERVLEYWSAILNAGSLLCRESTDSDAPRCLLTGGVAFGDAIRDIMQRRDYAASVCQIGVYRELNIGWISYELNGEKARSCFLTREAWSELGHRRAAGTVLTRAHIGGEAIRRIVSDITQ